MKWTLKRVRTAMLVVLVLVLSVLAGIAVPAAMMPAYAEGPGDPGLVAFYRQTEGFVIDPLAARTGKAPDEVAACFIFVDGQWGERFFQQHLHYPTAFDLQVSWPSRLNFKVEKCADIWDLKGPLPLPVQNVDGAPFADHAYPNSPRWRDEDPDGRARH